MKSQFLVLVVLSIVSEIYGDCGCLKCSKDLQIVSPPYSPYAVIVKGGQFGERPAPHQQSCQQSHQQAYQQGYQQGAYIPINPDAMSSQTATANGGYQPVYAFRYKVQAPVIPPKHVSAPIVGLVARPDRLVLRQPRIQAYVDDGSCGSLNPACTSILNTYGGIEPVQHVRYYQPKNNGPLIESLSEDTYQQVCDCRYGRRKKRELPILRQGVNFLMGLLPVFLGFPFEHTVFEPLRHFDKRLGRTKGYKYGEVLKKPRGRKASETFLEKLQKLNGRVRRSVIFDADRLGLPFLKVTDVKTHLDESEEEEEEEEDDDEDGEHDEDEEEGSDSEEIVGRSNPREEEYLKPLNFEHLVPHNPIFYLLNAPIRVLHHFHKLGHQISPIFKSVPNVLINSRRYLRKFGKNLREDVLDFASNLIGDFDDLDTPNYRFLRPRRFRRSIEYEPEYSLVFGNQTEENSRKKRYILKVVDEDEVERYLREKLGGFVEASEKAKKKKKDSANKKKEDSNKRRLIVEQLSPKLIIDNNGIPFVEIDGVKRPLFLNRRSEEVSEEQKPESKESKEETKEDEETSEDIKEKINSVILQAKQSQNLLLNMQHNVPNQMIKDRINQILTEIQDLINLDLEKYSQIHSDLRRLQAFKELLTNEWKKILVQEKSNDISSKIHLLDDFKEMQILKDKAVEDIASVLSTGSNFMTKKLIKILVRLQKLQCIIYRVVEDFGERIKIGTEFDVRKEIKYVEFLSHLHFVVGRTTKDLESDLKRERDATLENEMKTLDRLRHLYENENDSNKLYEEAQLLWEFKNIDKLQKDTIAEMNEKISRSQKVRKELKILFDLLRQLENCEEKQGKLLADENKKHQFADHNHEEKEEQNKLLVDENRNYQFGDYDSEKKSNSGSYFRKTKLVDGKRKYLFGDFPEKRSNVENQFRMLNQKRHRNFQKPHQASTHLNPHQPFPHKTIVEDKKPIKLVSNGYTMTAYKVSDAFD